MSDPLVSLIVPVYKVKAYLERCLDSIVAQSYRPLEVIIINDGSPDRCEEIISRYEARWPFIKSFWQENQGLGAARNAGIARAKGEFLAFIDSDDYIETDYVSTMVRAMQKTESDVVVCKFYVHTSCFKARVFPLLTRSRNISGEEAARVSLKLYSIPTVAWNKLYRTNLFSDYDVRFPSIYYEDIATMSRVLVHARRVAIISKPLYHYCIRKTSITGHFRQKNIDDYLAAVQMIRQFLIEDGREVQWVNTFRYFLVVAEAQLLLEILIKMKSETLSKRIRLASQMHHKLRLFELMKPAGMIDKPA